MNRAKRPFYATIAVAMFFLVTLSACTGAQRLSPYASASLKGSDATKMAILPFDNLSKSQGAAKSLESMVMIEFLKQSPVTIIDPGEMASALSEERVRLATSIPKETLRNLGKKLGVDFFMVGVVHEFEVQMVSGAAGAGQVPQIALTLRIIDAASGQIVWAGNVSRTGKDRETVFGIGRVDSLNTLAEMTAQDLARAFSQSLQK